METRMKTTDFFNQQFKRKTHALLRFAFVAITIDYFIKINFSLESYEFIALNIICMVLALVIVPLFDVYILKDPLHAETINPLHYWVLGLFGDYQTILDGLNGVRRTATTNFEIAENLYLSKANRFLKKNGKPYTDPTGTIHRKAGHDSPFEPRYLIVIITAIGIIAINHVTDLLPQAILELFPLFSNTGLKLIAMYFFAFKLVPLIAGDDSIKTGKSNYVFWQNIWMGHFDLRVRRVTDEIAYINRKTAVLTQASKELDAIMLVP